MKAALLVFVFVALSAVSEGKTVPANDNTIKTRACQPPFNTLPFCNTSLPIDDRIKNLISLIHADEKPYLLTARNGFGGSPGPGSNISRIGLPAYDWGTNCIHGAQTSCVELKGNVLCPTSFPNPVNFGMTFNNSLFLEMGQVIASELRALWLLGATEQGAPPQFGPAGLDCWSPNINIARDPRWGRNQETASEDPHLNGQFGKWYTKGLQEGEDPRYLKVIVTLKHWDAYSLENADGFTRHNFNAIVTNHTLYDTYFPAFQTSIVEGNAKGVMCSYNAINGIPTCANPFLASVLRSWGYSGYITSDTGAITDIYARHKYVATPEEAACKAITSGRCDINSGPVYHNALLTGVQKGLCTMADVDSALTNTLRLRFQLGLFDPIETQPYWHVPPSSIATPQSQALNLLSALESMVLLKNDGKTLPFPPGRTVALIGPHSNASRALVGNYLGQLCPNDDFSCVQTLSQGIVAANKGGSVLVEPGCPLTKNDSSLFPAAVAAAKQADYVILAMGIDESIESESHDRISIDLPYIQHSLIDTILKLGKPTVLVLINGGMVGIDKEKDTVPAILEAGYPGYYGAAAIAKTIFGTNDHLGGKLPYTIYPANYVNEVAMSYMEMEPKAGVSPGRTYRYYTGPTIYPFGHGLSYTSFSISPVACKDLYPLSLSSPSSQLLSFHIQNVGTNTGDEVLLVFVSPAPNHNTRVLKKLVNYQRVHLAPTEALTVNFNLKFTDLAFIDRDTAESVVLPGLYRIIVTNGVDETLSCPIKVVL